MRREQGSTKMPAGTRIRVPAAGREVNNAAYKERKSSPTGELKTGSVTHCHPGFSAEATRAFIPYLKDQHRWMWPNKTAKKLQTAADYLRL